MANVTDMTKGKPLAMIIQFTIPLLIGNVFQQLYNMVDSIVVGNYVGADALASVSLCGSTSFLMIALCNGLSSGAGIMIAQMFGSKKDEEIRPIIINVAYFLSGLSLVVSIAGAVLTPQILQLLSTPEDIAHDAAIYLRTMCIGMIAVALYNGVASVLRALGDSRTPLYFLILSSLVNLALDILFVVGFSWGVFGAALATVISQLTAMAASIIYAFYKIPYFRFTRKDMDLEPKVIGKILRLGAPLSLQGSMIAISIMVLQGVVNSFGATVVAAYGICGRIEQLISQPFNSLSIALSNYTGQNMGANRIDRVKRGFFLAFCIVLVFSLVVIPIFWLFAPQIVGIFVKEPEVIELGAAALRITSLFYLALGMIYVPRGLLNGAGDTTFSMINGGTEVGCRMIYSQILTRIPALGFWGIWLTTGATWLTTASICVLRYYSGRWKEKVLVRKKE